MYLLQLAGRRGCAGGQSDRQGLNGGEPGPDRVREIVVPNFRFIDHARSVAGVVIDEHWVCGSAHSVPIDTVVIGVDALERLSAYARERRLSKPLVIMDANAEEAAGLRMVDELSSAKDARCHMWVTEHTGLLADGFAV